MKHLTLIVATNHDGAIGVGNQLPWRLRSDLKFFRDTTLDHTVLMGRKTFESLGSKPLPGRFNIVLSHGYNLMINPGEGQAAHSVAEALVVADKRNRSESCFIIGGASIYEQFVQFADRCLLTLVDKVVSNADTFLDRNRLFSDKDWKVDNHRTFVGDGVVDEVNFTVFEMFARDIYAVREQRRHMIAEYCKLAAAQVSRRSSNRMRPDIDVSVASLL